MFPVLLVLLPAALSSAAPPEDSTGLKFTVAFPENIAYYHPNKPENKIKITALYNNTEVIIKKYTSYITGQTLSSGQTWEYAPAAGLELARAKISNHTLQITGTKTITVHVVFLKNSSVQTTLVIPTDKLGTEYLIPPVPLIEGTTHPAANVTVDVTERGPFRLIIINTDQKNKVTIQGAVPKDVWLQPHQVTQVWVKQEEALQAVKAEQPVAVLFGHTCAIRHSCTCGQLYTMLPPASEEHLKFYVPPVLAKDAEGQLAPQSSTARAYSSL
ncbi:IgGFc-binding protein-like [Chelmon rostratus]|uniref:IgGFc-binding protein-like n=1 Tax=Chelmon rostratus TaxID=109905 RepID=UPI001BEB07A3|nr:IgGFc-binding protein-like [Chelmon rostratus]